jgi:hypothetical protein
MKISFIYNYDSDSSDRNPEIAAFYLHTINNILVSEILFIVQDVVGTATE